MKVINVVLVALILALASARPQFERGSIYAPSGRFAMTDNWAAPPVDLSLPVIFLPEATPIRETPQEPMLTSRPRPLKKN
ncbi:hypothetical protein AWZ03_002920 [Drosophila navojoa]|uniref:Uncharacterized protein n=1 Tax=Drosophila navojoa TaxID=7232 RepID=A0A484BP42_DRONA|nr:uncharacterized protein LOC108655107 [Drosophila navojoa]TDG50616.1 hypothetical protein AWZ03_002920 [Drosophila navojoa]